MGTNLKVVIALSAGVLILSILLAVRLKTSVEQTQKNEESRKELMAGISHDLRSPLTSIKAYVEGLLDGIAETPEARTRYLLTIQRKVEDIDRMVNQIFTFSKLELDEYPMEIRTVDLDQEIRQIVKESSAEYEKKGLQISLEKQESNGVIILKDDGKGVAPEALPKLFDVFYRTDPARKNPAGGSGLGLDGFTVCRKLREKIDTPILMVTAKHEDIDKIRGLGQTTILKSRFRQVYS